VNGSVIVDLPASILNERSIGSHCQVLNWFLYSVIIIFIIKVGFFQVYQKSGLQACISLEQVCQGNDGTNNAEYLYVNR